MRRSYLEDDDDMYDDGVDDEAAPGDHDALDPDSYDDDGDDDDAVYLRELAREPKRRGKMPKELKGRLTDLPKELRDQARELAGMPKAEEYSPDPHVWLRANRMTQTEVSLRLAQHLVETDMVSSTVLVSLTAHELARTKKPKFPVQAYLAERGWKQEEGASDWQGVYAKPDKPHGLRLHTEPALAGIMANLVSGRGLVIHVWGGMLGSSRSPAEHNILHRVLGRTLTFQYAKPDDVIAVAVPRSERFREIAVKYREAPGVLRMGILILTVGRAGEIEGFPRPNPLA